MKRLFSKLVPEVLILVAATLLVTMPSLRGTATGLATVFPFPSRRPHSCSAGASTVRACLRDRAPALTEYCCFKGVEAPGCFYYQAMTFLLPINLALVASCLSAARSRGRLMRWCCLACSPRDRSWHSPSRAKPSVFSRLRCCRALDRLEPVSQPSIVAFLGSAAALHGWLREPQSP